MLATRMRQETHPSVVAITVVVVAAIFREEGAMVILTDKLVSQIAHCQATGTCCQRLLVEEAEVDKRDRQYEADDTRKQRRTKEIAYAAVRVSEIFAVTNRTVSQNHLLHGSILQCQQISLLPPPPSHSLHSEIVYCGEIIDTTLS